jgi:hypothetical protein
MKDKHTEELAALYVLDLLEGPERSAFEEQLVGSGELRRLVRELSTSLHQPARPIEGPERADLLTSIHKRLEEKPVEPEPESSRPAVLYPQPLPWSAIWGAAAAILLLMNLILIGVLRNQSTIRDREVLAGGPGRDADGQLLTQPGDPLEGRPQLLEARLERLQSELQHREEELAETLRAREELEDEYQEVKAYNQGWQREYMRLAARFLPFFESNDGMTRFTVIEMVDAEAFSNQMPRRGFADLAGQFLAGEGNIAGAVPGEFVGPVAAGIETPAAFNSDEGGLQPMARGSESEPEPADSSVLGGDSAMGFTVWRDDEQKGFLDIYNLPVAPDGSKPFLWVRSSDLEDYLPIGFLPELENGTGSVFYSVEEPNFTPVEIIITAEDASEASQDPSGTVLLRGP